MTTDVEHFGGEIDGVRLNTGPGGVFTIRVDGDRVYDSTRGFALDRVIADIEART